MRRALPTPAGAARPRARRCRSTATLHPLLRWDSKTEFVQAIKLGRWTSSAGTAAPCRPPRQPLAPEQELARAGAATAGRRSTPGWPDRCAADGVLHAVDSHTEGMPTRVITGGVGVIPGATMAERRRWFVPSSDDLRTLLMYEPRGHAAMSGAILQPPTRPDADYGVLFIEVSGCLPMCGHGTIGVATVLVETGMVRGHRAGDDDPARHPGRAGRGRGRGRATARPRRSRSRNVAVLLATPSTRRSTCPGSGTVRYDLAYGGNFYAIVRAGRPRAAVRPGRAAAAARRRARGHGRRSTTQDRAGPPERPDIRGLPPRLPRRARVGRPRTRGTRWRSTRAGSTASPCGTGTSARMAQLHARGELGARTPTSSTSRSSAPGSRAGWSSETTTRRRARPAVVPTITGRAWITGTAQYFLDPTDPFPAGFLL